MKTTFFCKLINNAFGDPVLLVRFRGTKEAFLFDLGDISYMSVKDILRISSIFVTHMHIDHFIGFDTLVRCLLSREVPVSLYGPEGIIEAVASKLRGFTWNLVREYPLKFEVYEVQSELIRHCSFYAQDEFGRIERPASPFHGVVYSSSGLNVCAAILNHGIPVLGYALTEDYHINIDRDGLDRMGLSVGPWLNELKHAIREDVEDMPLYVDGREYPLSDLRSLAIITEGQKIAYITDITPSESNIESAIELATSADTLYIEAFFLSGDIERAFKRNHLTTTHAGLIARRAKAKNIEVIHVSPKYIGSYNEVVAEVISAYSGKD